MRTLKTYLFRVFQYIRQSHQFLSVPALNSSSKSIHTATFFSNNIIYVGKLTPLKDERSSQLLEETPINKFMIRQHTRGAEFKAQACQHFQNRKENKSLSKVMREHQSRAGTQRMRPFPFFSPSDSKQLLSNRKITYSLNPLRITLS